MPTTLKHSLLATLVALLFTAADARAFNIYLVTLPEIAGEVTAKGYEKAWQLASFSHGVSRNLDSNGNPVSAPQFPDFAVAKFLDTASVQLLLRTAQGEVIDKVTISFVHEQQPNYVPYKVVLEKVLVTSISQGGTAGTIGPISENVTLHFRKITWTYTPMDASGKIGSPITAFWDRNAGL